jgi:hypothetical protein
MERSHLPSSESCSPRPSISPSNPKLKHNSKIPPHLNDVHLSLRHRHRGPHCQRSQLSVWLVCRSQNRANCYNRSTNSLFRSRGKCIKGRGRRKRRRVRWSLTPFWEVFSPEFPCGLLVSLSATHKVRRATHHIYPATSIE